MLTQERLKELLHYDPETGIFTRLVRTSSSTHVGDIAGGLRPDGYWSISIDNRRFLAHRLAYLYMYGEFPQDKTDHRDQTRDNNRIANLRPVTNKQNIENRGMSPLNTSGFPGVSWYKKGSKWHAQIKHNYENIHIGYFDTPEEASAAYEAMRDKLFTHHKKAA